MVFTRAEAQTLRESVAFDLIDVADDVRDLATELGVRPYRVFIVVTRWSGGARSVGVEMLVRETELLPTPKVSGLEGLDAETSEIGYIEVGGVTVAAISGRYTEEQLRGADAEGNAPQPDENVWWEIAYSHPNSAGAYRRRFTLERVLEYQPGSVQWVVGLSRAQEDRSFVRGDLGE